MSSGQTISIPAARLYAAVVHLSRDWDRRHVNAFNLTIANDAKIDMSELADAQDELVRASLLTILRLGAKTKYSISQSKH